LQPVILDVQGRVVDGKHRLEVNPNWKVEKHDEIKTDRDLWLTRLHLNDARRNAHEARKEKIEGIAGLAEYYEKQGLTVFGSKTVHGGGHQNEILDAVIKDLAGAISENFIRVNIPDKYVQGQRESASVKQATLSKKRPKSRGVETQDFVPSGRVLEDSSRLLSVMNAWSYDQFADLKDADWTVLKVILSQIEERIKWVRDGGWKEETAVDFDSMASETEEKKAKADGAEEIAG
jgi:hypothetical protein